jgi:hypothetical protein
MIEPEMKHVHPSATLRDLLRMARELFITPSMRRQWVRKTWWLLENGKHACQCGGFNMGEPHRLLKK